MTDYDEDASGVALIIENAKAATQPTVLNIDLSSLDEKGLPSSIPVLWNHDDQRLISLKEEISRYREFPKYRTGKAEAQTIQSFIDLVTHHKTDATVIFGDFNWKNPSLTAVIDYHPSREMGGAEGDPGRLSHRIGYAFPRSEEWNDWIKMNGERLDQEVFALLVEDRIHHFASPTPEESDKFGEALQTKVGTPSDVMKLARGMQVTINAHYKRAVTLQTGETQIVYSEEHNGADGEAVKIPGAFILQIPVFYDAMPIRLPVRLRYRAAGGKVAWFYQLYQPDVIMMDALRKARVLVDNQLGEVSFFEGAPESHDPYIF